MRAQNDARQRHTSTSHNKHTTAAAGQQPTVHSRRWQEVWQSLPLQEGLERQLCTLATIRATPAAYAQAATSTACGSARRAACRLLLSGRLLLLVLLLVLLVLLVFAANNLLLP
jgi:hypothetical protein